MHYAISLLFPYVFYDSETQINALSEICIIMLCAIRILTVSSSLPLLSVCPCSHSRLFKVWPLSCLTWLLSHCLSWCHQLHCASTQTELHWLDLALIMIFHPMWRLLDCAILLSPVVDTACIPDVIPDIVMINAPNCVRICQLEVWALPKLLPKYGNFSHDPHWEHNHIFPVEICEKAPINT